MQPSSYDCLTGDVSVAEAARPAGPDNLWLVPASRDLAGASVELPRLEGSETRLRDRLGPVRERFAVTVLDCPPSLGPVSVNALVAADRVIVPVQAEYLALEGLVQFLDTLAMIRREMNPSLDVSGLLDHDARRAHAARPGRRARAARALPGDGLRDRDPAQRPGRRGAELWSPGDRARSLLARFERLPGAGRGDRRPWLEKRSAPRAGSARASAAAWRRSCRRSAQGDAGELRELPVGLVKPNPNQPRTHFDQDALDALAASIETTGVVQPLLVRPLHDGSYELIAGERRWRAAQQAGLEKVPAVVRDSEQAERLQVALIENMVREDLNPIDEARACAALIEELGVSKEDLARRVGRSRPAVSNLIRLLELPDELLDLLESGELSEGHGKALLAAQRQRRASPPGAATPPGTAGRSARPRTGLSWPASQSQGRGRRRWTRRSGGADARPRRSLEAALGHEVKVRPRKGEEVAVEIRFDDLDRGARRWPGASAQRRGA